MSAQWFQVEITDTGGLAGHSVVRLVRVVADAAAVRFCAVVRAEGAGPAFASRFPAGKTVVHTIDEFAAAGADVVQFDWGDFLLGRDGHALALLQPSTPYEQVLAAVAAMIRAVDDTYLYVYTQSADVLTAVRLAYPDAVVSERDLTALEFPD